MKIKPVFNYQRIIPTAFALLSGVVGGCDRQHVVGSVPNTNPQQEENDNATDKSQQSNQQQENKSQEAGDEMIEELPQLLSGDVPVENLHIDR